MTWHARVAAAPYTLHPAPCNLHTYSIGHAVSQRNIATIHHTSASPVNKTSAVSCLSPGYPSSLSLSLSLSLFFARAVLSLFDQFQSPKCSNGARREDKCSLPCKYVYTCIRAFVETSNAVDRLLLGIRSRGSITATALTNFANEKLWTRVLVCDRQMDLWTMALGTRVDRRAIPLW